MYNIISSKLDDVFIREANESDLPEINRLAVELIISLDSKEGIDKNKVLSNCQTILGKDTAYILVAEIKGKVVGFINFTIRSTVLHSGPSGLIDELVVNEHYRDKGTGKKLVDAAIENCKKFGCCEVEVSTEITNKKAVEFYKKCGFKKRGIILERDLLQ